jgi:DNA-binding XRE family transcriptional regulator
MEGSGPVSSLGEAIRRQRELSKVSMRQFASMAGISNPYLSQIERGLRAPSEHVLEAIAQSLHTSADALQDQAAALSGDQPTAAVVAAIEADPDLTGRQRQALIESYTAMTELTVARRRRGRRAEPTPDPDDDLAPDPASRRGETTSGTP